MGIFNVSPFVLTYWFKFSHSFLIQYLRVIADLILVTLTSIQWVTNGYFLTQQDFAVSLVPQLCTPQFLQSSPAGQGTLKKAQEFASGLQQT